MTQLKIIHLIASNEIGGAERVLMDMCNYISGSEITCEACLFYKTNKNKILTLINNLMEHNIKVHFVKMQFPLYLFEVVSLIKIFRKSNPSIVHCHGFRADVIGGFVAKLCKIKTVATVHGWIAYSHKMRFYKWLDLKALKFFFEKVLPVSDALKNELLKNMVRKSKIKVIRNVPTQLDYNKEVDASDSRHSCIQLGYIGRLSEEKGIMFLINAIDKIKIKRNIHLHLVGEGPLRLEIEDKVRELDIESTVTIHGHLKNIEEVYRKIDVLILPSLTEGIPLTLLEAMSYGIAVIASNVGGIPEIIENEKDGILVLPGSVIDLYDKILFLIDKPELRQKLGEEAKEKVNFVLNRKVWKRDILAIYKSISE